MKEGVCNHLQNLEIILTEKKHECDECVKTGDRWLHLRTCQTCGTTLCCDSSPNKHASRHAAKANHPVAISSEPGERWAWCYVDEQIVEY
ncbi:MAG: UBP-type zinc finger domain-containing protein [Cyclobacteriaceae bacterium]|nr:UBP-type zinc finger domain-containing protein [Cyclobacteriaceae bacterium]